MEQGVGEDVGVDLQRVLDFVSAAAAATFGVRGVVEAVVRVDDDDFSIEENATEAGFGAGFGKFQVFDLMDRAENFVIHGNVFKAIVAEEAFDLTLESGVPCFVGAGSGGEQEAAVFEVFFEVVALGGGEVEIAFAGHDGERNFEKFLGGEFDRFEFPFGGDGGFLLNGGEEFIAETFGGFGSGVDEVSAFDRAFFGKGDGGC